MSDASVRRIGSLRSLVVIVPALVGLVITLPLAWGSEAAGFFTDGVSYLAMADIFSPWRAADGVAAAIYERSRFPPGFPALLALIGGGSTNESVAFVFNAVLHGVAGGLLAWIVRQRTGSSFVGLVAGVAAVLSPLFLRVTLEITSEPLFVVLMLATIVAVDRRMSETPSKVDVLPGLIAGVALLARDVALPMTVALLVIAALRKRRALALGALIGAVPYILWRLSRSAYAISISYESRVRDGIVAMAGDPIGFIAGNLTALGTAALRGSSFQGFTSTEWLAATVIAAGIAGAAIQFRRLDFAALTFFGMLALIAAWPHAESAERFALPFWPLLLLFVAQLAARARAIPGLPRAASAVVLVLLLVPLREWWVAAPRLAWRLSGPAAAFDGTLDRFTAPSRQAFEQRTDSALRLALAASALPQHVVPGERLCSGHSVYAIHRSRLWVEELSVSTDEAVARQLADCDVVFVTVFATPMLGIPSYFPFDRIDGSAYQPRFVSQAADGLTVAALLEPARAGARDGNR